MLPEQTYAYDALVNIAESKDPQLHNRIQTHAIQLSLAHHFRCQKASFFLGGLENWCLETGLALWLILQEL